MRLGLPCMRYLLTSDLRQFRLIPVTRGVLTFSIFICRFFVFDVQESSKFLVAQGRDQEAIEVLEHIARRNGVSITLKLEDLQAVCSHTASKPAPKLSNSLRNAISTLSLYVAGRNLTTTIVAEFVVARIFVRSFPEGAWQLTRLLQYLSGGMQLMTESAFALTYWCSPSLIGIASPLFSAYLPLYLEQQGAATSSSSVSVAYRNYSIISILGIPGSIIACAVVDYTRDTGRWLIGGRKLALAVSTALSGLFLFLFTTSKTPAATLGYSCASGLTTYALESDLEIPLSD